MIITIKIVSITPQRLLCLFAGPPMLCPWLQVTLIFLWQNRLVCILHKCTHCIFFYVWLFLLSIHFRIFIRIVVCISNSFLFIASWYFVVWIYLYHLPVGIWISSSSWLLWETCSSLRSICWLELLWTSRVVHGDCWIALCAECSSLVLLLEHSLCASPSLHS